MTEYIEMPAKDYNKKQVIKIKIKDGREVEAMEAKKEYKQAVKLHRAQIKQAKRDIKRHKMLIKQAKLSYKITK